MGDGNRGTPTMVIRVVRPDGSVREIVRDDDGRVAISRLGADGSLRDRTVAVLGRDGDLRVAHESPAGESTEMPPTDVERRSNPYGVIVDRLVYPGLTVEKTFDDDAALQSVSMRGDWGEQTMELRPDGSRTFRWETPGQHGIRTWNSAGRLDHDDVSCSDGTTYRWGAEA